MKFIKSTWDFIKETFQRFAKPTNDYWVTWIKIWLVVLGIAAGGETVADKILENGAEDLPEWVRSTLHHLRYISPVAAFVSKFTKDEFAEKLKEAKDKEKNPPLPDIPDTEEPFTEEPFPENPPITNNDITKNDLTNPLTPIGEIVVPSLVQTKISPMRIVTRLTEEEEAPEKNIQEISDSRNYIQVGSVRWRKKH